MLPRFRVTSELAFLAATTSPGLQVLTAQRSCSRFPEATGARTVQHGGLPTAPVMPG
jgi:hypothetical protein